jgi:3'-5' exoribonuclease
MSRRAINQLGDHESIDQVFLAADKQLRPNRSGNLYLSLRLSDRTGTVMGMMWNANDRVYREFDNGDYVRVEGNSQFYNGALQIIVTSVERVSDSEIDEADFVLLGPNDIDHLRARMAEILRSLTNLPLRNLAECLLVDESLMDRFCQAPAGVKNHHAYRGGLIEHVVNLMEVALLIGPRYPELDTEQLVVGCLLHDMGKLVELSYDRDFAYTDEGQLLGHVVIAVGMLDKLADDAEKLSGEPIPEELVLRLKHMIVSHHGQYDFGSPKLPMTLEAVALYCIDNLDAKVASFEQQLRDDPNVDSAWTIYNANLGRRLFKGYATESE